jgi:hypothetical protein
MRRRDFISRIVVSTAMPVAARAQQPGRIYRLGDLHLSPRNAPWNVALFDAVKADGFVDGQNLIVTAKVLDCASSSFRNTLRRLPKPMSTSLLPRATHPFVPHSKRPKKFQFLVPAKIWSDRALSPRLRILAAIRLASVSFPATLMGSDSKS